MPSSPWRWGMSARVSPAAMSSHRRPTSGRRHSTIARCLSFPPCRRDSRCSPRRRHMTVAESRRSWTEVRPSPMSNLRPWSRAPSAVEPSRCPPVERCRSSHTSKDRHTADPLAHSSAAGWSRPRYCPRRRSRRRWQFLSVRTGQRRSQHTTTLMCTTYEPARSPKSAGSGLVRWSMTGHRRWSRESRNCRNHRLLTARTSPRPRTRGDWPSTV